MTRFDFSSLNPEHWRVRHYTSGVTTPDLSLEIDGNAVVIRRAPNPTPWSVEEYYFAGPTPPNLTNQDYLMRCGRVDVVVLQAERKIGLRGNDIRLISIAD